MTDIFYGPAGNNGNDGLTEATAYLDHSVAITNSSTGDTIFQTNGTYTAPTHLDLSADREFNVKAVNRRAAVIRPGLGESSRAARIGGSATAVNPSRISGMVFDAQKSDGVYVIQAFDFTNDPTDDLIEFLIDCEFRGGTNSCVLNSMRRGEQYIIGCKFASGSSSLDKGFITTSSSAGDSNQVLVIDSLDINGLELTAANANLIQIQKVNNLTNTYSVSIKGVMGTVTFPTGIVKIATITGVDAPVFSGSSIICKDSAASSQAGIYIRGLSVATCTGAVVSNCYLESECEAAFLVQMGDGSVDDFMSGFVVAGVVGKGRFSDTGTPHGINIGRNSSGSSVIGNIISDMYVGILASRTMDGVASGNLMVDCYGSSYYSKGTTDFTYKDNVAVLTGKNVQKINGILAINSQDGVNTVNASYESNLIVVVDTDSIYALAQRLLNQSGTYTRNVYMISESILLAESTLLKFDLDGVLVSLDTWNADASNTNDRFVQVSDDALAVIAKSYVDIANAAALASQTSIVKPIVNNLTF